MNDATPDGGFTLIEVLVAFIVLALALAGVYAALADSARVQADLALRDNIMAEAQSHIDRYIAGPLDDRRNVGPLCWRGRVARDCDAAGTPRHSAERRRYARCHFACRSRWSQ